MPFSFIDLFAGIGGTRLGFEAAGGECVFSSERDRFAQTTYSANHGDLPAGDIAELELQDIPPHDVLVAGFPCQPFSIAGVSKNNSLGRKNGFEHPDQGHLFFSIVDILSYRRPRAFMLENVKHLLRHDGGHTYQVISDSLEALGYSVSAAVIDAKLLVPQHRERIYIVGFRRSEDTGRMRFPRVQDRHPRLRDILQDDVADKYTLSDRLWEYLQGYAAKHQSQGNGFGYGLPDLGGTTRTLSARYYKDGSEILVRQPGRNPRRLTPRECARLMGFPERFVIPVSDTRAYQQFGNSVVVPVVERVARQVVAAMEQPLPRSGSYLRRWRPRPVSLPIHVGSGRPITAVS